MRQRIYLLIILCAINFTNCNNSTQDIPNDLILSRYTKYGYNGKGQLISESDYDVFTKYDSLHSVLKIEYNNKGLIAKKVNWTKGVSKFNTYVYQYDSLGNKISETIFDKYDKMVVKWKYQVNDKKQFVLNYRYNQDTSLLYKVRNYFNSRGKLFLTTYYDSTDKIIRKDTTIWIDKNNSKNLIIDSTGTSLQCMSVYDDENLIKVIQYNSNGNISETYTWENFINGDATIFKIIDSKGAIETMMLDIYNDDGKLIKTEWYKNKNKK